MVYSCFKSIMAGSHPLLLIIVPPFFFVLLFGRIYKKLNTKKKMWCIISNDGVRNDTTRQKNDIYIFPVFREAIQENDY